MGSKFNSWTDFYKKIYLWYNGIIAISLLPFTWVFLENQDGRPPILDWGGNQWIFFILFLPLIGGLLNYGYRSFQPKVNEIAKDLPVYEKLENYLQLAIKRYMIYELSAIICLVAFYLSQEILFAILYLFILFVFSLARPKYDTISLHLGLSSDEEKELRKEN